MADINLTFGADDLKKVVAELNKAVAKFEAAMKKAGNVTDDDVTKIKRLAIERKKLENQMKKEELAGKRIADQQARSNTKLKEAKGIIGGMAQKTRELQSALKAATNPKDIARINKELKKTREAMARAKGTTASWGKALGSFQFKFNALGNIAANVVGQLSRQLKQFAKESLAAYDTQIKAEKALLVAMEGRITATDRLIRQAAQLQKRTLFGDEETIKAQALIAAMVDEEAAIRRIIPLVQDFATAKSMSLAGAADLVSKTLGSSTNAMSRYGIAVEGNVGSTERLESLVLGLNKAFGGQAEAAAFVDSQFTSLKNTIGDVQENLGGFIADVIFMAKVNNNLFARAEKGWEAVSVAEGKARKELFEFRNEYEDIDSATAALDKILVKQKEIEEQYKIAHTEAATAKRKDFDAANYALETIKDQKDAYKLLIPELEVYISSLSKSVTETEDLGDAVDDVADDVKTNLLPAILQVREALDFSDVDLGEAFWAEFLGGFDEHLPSQEEAFKEHLEKIGQMIDTSADEQNAKIRTTEEKKRAAIQETYDLAKDGLLIFSNLFEAQKQKELSAAGANAQKRLAIEKEYQKKQQALAIVSAVINTAEGIVKVLADYGLPWGLIPAAAMAALGGAQIATIKSQKFAEGGPVIGEAHSRGGVQLEAEGGEYIINKKSTGKYKSLIEAINQDDQVRIMDAMSRDKKITINQVDPYTQKMYDLMKSQPVYGEDNEFYYKHKGNMLIKTKKR